MQLQMGSFLPNSTNWGMEDVGIVLWQKGMQVPPKKPIIVARISPESRGFACSEYAVMSVKFRRAEISKQKQTGFPLHQSVVTALNWQTKTNKLAENA